MGSAPRLPIPFRERRPRHTMKKQLRLTAVLAGAVMFAAACTGGGATTAPSEGAAAAPSEGAEAAAPSEGAAALEGELTLWHSYSSGAGTELDALNTVLETVKAANPGLTVNVLEVPFNDLFNKYNTDAATGGGPDLFIAPNDSMGAQARDGVIADLTTNL